MKTSTALALAATFAAALGLGTAAQAGPAKPRWSLAIHGGAGTMSREAMTSEKEAEYRAALDRALAAGTAVLERGGSAMDAVEAAVVMMEDDPRFNAGRGAVFAWDGANELDAAIMDGRTRAAGAVTGVTRTRNPVRLARAVMADGRHVFLSGAGADQFSREKGLEQADPAWFATPERRRQLDEMKAKQLSAIDVDRKFGTVGAVALDVSGHVAAATSTGGMTGKRWGRIGDAPVIGAGTYADDRACAVSATGSGEYFIRAGVAHEICARLRLRKESAQKAADAVIAEVGALGGDGGVIVVTPRGEAVFAQNTPGMYRARATSAGLRQVAIFRGE
ncbi:isoaspartyl peptidase/L-asparaginase [Novosphingobium sp.]|uniref:isoaspartyl peptidase/L-asparaginase family protein n=1 Tax=Novosphingobium sp. TaxID=1874826 RepID=UPI001EC71120|nr:isoaspartyl peptidase/L-asparaginase [Novosphingobium sp.]MBK6803055.1 isoaspartyl peptidase/L-asparaginase [Novosphingobium sp.]MBK9012096.1 isoaspartyl peptidase/L-asparaginase [Novosphingobium sp.]